MPVPVAFEWRIESRAPNGFTKFLPFGDDRNYLINRDKHVEAITMKVTGWGDCLEASVQALKSRLPNDHLSSADVVGASIRYATTGSWSDIYAGLVTSPGAPNSYEISTVNLLGLRKRLYETVVPPRFGVVTGINADPWTVDVNQDGRTGDVGQVIRNLIASVIAQLGGNGATLSKVLSGVPAVTGYTVTVDPNFNSVGELIDKILELIPAAAGQKAIWGVDGKREVFMVTPGGAIGLTVVNSQTPGVSIEWGAVDSSKVISSVRWVGFSIDRDSWFQNAEIQNFVTHQSVGDQSFGFSAIRENIPENMITGKVSTTDSDGIRYKTVIGGTTYVASLPYVAASDVYVAHVFMRNQFDGGAGAWGRVDGVRINAEINKKTDTAALLTIGIMNGGSSASPVEQIPLLDGDHDYWFSGHRAADGTQQYATEASIDLFDYTSANYTIKAFQFLGLDTPLLDRIAESRYRFPAPDACTITVDGVILEPKPLVEITFRAINGTMKTVTRVAETFEYSINANGYPVTTIRAGQARDANESAVWSEIKSRDKKATVNAVAYAARGR